MHRTVKQFAAAQALFAIAYFGAAPQGQGQASLRAGATAQVVSGAGNDFDTAEQDWITAAGGSTVARSASALAGSNASTTTFTAEFGRLRGKSSAVLVGTGSSMSASSSGTFASINNFVGAGFFDTITLAGPGEVSLRVHYSFHSVNVDPNDHTLAETVFKLDTFSTTLGNRNEPAVVHSGAGDRRHSASFLITGMAGDTFDLLAEMSSFSSVNLPDGVSGSHGASSDATNTASITIEPLSGSFTSLSGATYPTAAAQAPEIKVMQGTGPAKNLQDNESRRNFGSVKVGESSKAMVFVIKNDGTAALKNVKITMQGAQADHFKIITKPARSLAPGERTSFKIAYKPGASKGSKAKLHISSTDADENPFTVTLIGRGVK